MITIRNELGRNRGRCRSESSHFPLQSAMEWNATLTSSAARLAIPTPDHPQRPLTGQEPDDVLDLIPHPLVLIVGLAVGLLIAAPVGPVNVMCIQRAIERGVTAGILAGLGAVLGDGLIALLAALGVGQITGAITLYRDVIQIIGGLVLGGFGLMLSRSRPRFVAEPGARPEWSSLRDHLWDVPKTFLLTITNPGAVLGLIAIFGGVSSFVEVQSTVQALWLVAAIIAGSLAWWVFLSMMVGRIRHKVTEHRLAQINHWAGTLLVLFGVLLVGEVLLKAAWRTWGGT